MKSFLAGCGAAVLVLVLAVVVLLVWGFRKGAQEQEQFFAAVYSGDMAQLTALFDPALTAEVDEPLLAAWAKAMKERLGAPKGLSARDFSTNTRYEGGATITESSGKVTFEQGEAQSELVLRNGKIIQFNVKSDQLVDWLTDLEDTRLYEDKGRDCLELIMTGKANEAHAMMHENLQEALSLEALTNFANETLPETGSLRSITLDSKDFEAGDSPTLELAYTIGCENKTMKATIRFEFVGLKGHLVAVNIAPSD